MYACVQTCQTCSRLDRRMFLAGAALASAALAGGCASLTGRGGAAVRRIRLRGHSKVIRAKVIRVTSQHSTIMSL